MLQLRNISKTYKPKKGVPVKALNDVSIDFEETGLVFLLGKSGSGKSTLLNIIGGLEIADEGEIIIKGKSSKEFKSSDFDSYRNTFIGFIFQEYNILNDFNVEKNISLALELQGKKATKEVVNNLLEQVDLKGYGKRKINEMSGGQKQRVAIARALIKDPEIIFADEPTGALDSNTGKQVFDTLKKLSKTKLVVVVSHDREFAEIYGDRIIELKDGCIIKDERKVKAPPMELTPGFKLLGENMIQIEKGHKLSNQEKDFIISTIESSKDDIMLSLSEDTNSELRRKSRIDENGNTEEFTQTTKESLNIKQYNKNDLKLIKSKMKFRDSFKIGASSLKVKPVRLIFTIILSLVAFAMFGVVDSMSSYEYLNTMAKSIQDSEISTFGVSKEYITETEYGYENKSRVNLSLKDINKIEKETGINFTPVYNFKDEYEAVYFSPLENKNNKSYYYSSLSGIIVDTESNLRKIGYEIDGNLPTYDYEVAITKYTAECLQYYGFRGRTTQEGTDIEYKSENLNDLSTIKNKWVEFNMNDNYKRFKIVGIVDTGIDGERYINEDTNDYSFDNMLKQYEFEIVKKFGYHNLLFVTNNYMNSVMLDDASSLGYPIESSGTLYLNVNDVDININSYSTNIININNSSQSNNFQKYYFNGRTNLSKNGILLDLGCYMRNRVQQSNNELYNAFTSCSDINTFLNENINTILADTNLPDGVFSFYNNKTYEEKNTKFKVEGFCYKNDYQPSDWSNTFFMLAGENVCDAIVIEDGDYAFAVSSALPESQKDLKKVLQGILDLNSKSYNFTIKNEVSYTLDSIGSLVETLSQVLLYVGIGFAVFSSLMLMNFISTSISYKKREIGILRAIGARSKDVFGIFFNESLLIAMINCILACITSFVAVTIINNVLRNQYGLLITIMSFGLRQILLLVGISVLVAFVSSIIPVMKISKKKPIDAINNR